MNNLFQQLILEANKLGYELSDKELKKVYKLQKTNRDELLNELALIILKYDIKGESLNLNSRDRQLLKQEINKIINDAIKAEIRLEKEITKHILETVTKETHNLRNYILSLGTIAKVSILTEKELLKIVNTVVNGEIWSDRLWKNKKQLEKDLKSMINDFLNGRISVNQIYKEVKDIYGNNAYCSKRLTETEICRCQEAANEEFAKQQGIEWMLFMATLDNKTSKKCRGYDGKVFKVNDANKPLPPLHPNCRSCMVLIPSREWRPKNRRDNTTIRKHIDYTDYEEWKNRTL
ncbi:minor capsid protein [Paraclostridium bifermentans]|uniref:minor capsid protein n=1 Tax=Paraclostridium bifermentans TaxID=1490 RepID=UPI002912B904|nr:minor capsid protein [Paraclostridium bifermentans]MDU3337950.1 minor capsid protein [Paraclostridium bifermentans]